MSIAKVLGKGQIVIPKKIREDAKISPGDKVEVKMTKEGIVIIPVRKTHTDRYKGIIRGKLSMKKLESLYKHWGQVLQSNIIQTDK
jgi:AbrB family looped-hinge helix DNA binding protein